MAPSKITTISSAPIDRSRIGILCIDDRGDQYEYPNIILVIDIDSDMHHIDSFSNYTRQNISISWMPSTKEITLLSRRGEYEILDIDLLSRSTENISGSEISNPVWKNYGYMTVTRNISSHSYTAGMGGQIYRRLNAGNWTCLTPGLRAGDSTKNWFFQIKGTDENSIYAAGVDGIVCHLHDSMPKIIPVPCRETLTGMHIDDDGMVYISGGNGTLLRGNFQQGFEDLSSVDDNILFHAVVRYAGRLFLGAAEGLFIYDEGSGRIRPYDTGLPGPRIQSTFLDVVDGVMWSVGVKDVARFDGRTWKRFDHPCFRR